jgi:hypothetical protein
MRRGDIDLSYLHLADELVARNDPQLIEAT